ncbi:hypothetical protein J1N35_010894, partial [Gossypium stocksii]
SYYRCTTTSCNVKKRVERSFTDPSMVITTYEGQHTHPSPIMPRSSLGGGSGSAPYHYQQHPQPFVNTLSPLNFGHNNGSINAGLDLDINDHKRKIIREREEGEKGLYSGIKMSTKRSFTGNKMMSSGD